MSAAALGSLGNDLAFSVSFNIASELLEAAKEAHLSEDELISIVLGIAVVLASLPAAVKSVWHELNTRRTHVSPAAQPAAQPAAPGGQLAPGEPPSAPPAAPPASSGIWEFAGLLVSIAQRISAAVCVQLLASNVRSQQPLRSVRVVSLLGVAIFFLFLESSSSLGRRSG